MEGKLFSLLAAGGVFFAVACGWNPSVQAALCSQCRELMFVDSDGKCSDCGGPTASAALRLCPKCSAKRHQCEHCLAATTQKDEAAAETKPAAPVGESPQNTGSHKDASRSDGSPAGVAQDKSSPGWAPPANAANSAKSDEPAAQSKGAELNFSPVPTKTATPEPIENLPQNKMPAELPPDPVAPIKHKPINPTKPGVYVSGKWRYQLQIASPGTQSEGRWGWLTYDGQKLPRGGVNDYYNTPWGPIFWVDVPTTAWGFHGWMPIPLSQNRRTGRALALPASLAATAADRPPAEVRVPASTNPLSTTAPVTPRPQKLEINQSHNGQLARLHVGNVLVIRLPGNPASGYQWRAATTNSAAVRVTVRPQYSPPVSSAASPAASGTYTFTFQAVQPGSGSIRLYYVRPDDPARPRESFVIGVNVSPATAAAGPVANSRQPGE
jgi:inhibitor of cysteine peptidase